MLLVLGLAASTMTSASAAGPGRAPWVTASSTTSITLDWPGGSSGYRTFYAASYGAVLKTSVSKKSTASKVRISGLRPGTMYCFQTARANGANRSQRYCHSTMRYKNKSGRSKVGVATFNVCGVASGCHGWSGRAGAVVQRIREADADVVNIQEGHRVLADIEARLAPLGYALASASSTEGVFYRRSRLQPVLRPGTELVCDDDVCQDVPVALPAAGTFGLGGSATAAWAQLRVKKTGKTYVFVSAHLRAGKSAGDARQRDAETRRLISLARAEAGTRPIVVAGDLNSHRNRPNDSPRKRLEAAGLADAYDRSARYANAFINSYNGWKSKPVRGVKYGDHVDHVFLPAKAGADRWAVVAPVRGGKNVRPIASDHNLVRVTALLP